MTRYDSIGRGYASARRPAPHIAARILSALGDCQSIVNVGAGTGSYEPRGRQVVAVEPSMVIIRQRSPASAPVVRASASALPFRDGTFDAALALLTLHHWPDLDRGLKELRRAGHKRTVIFTFDTSVGGFWLTDYFPEILEIDEKTMPPISKVRRHLGEISVLDVPIPYDCRDGFLGAYWRRPEAYLSAEVRNGISVFSQMANLEPGLSSLRSDLASGEWRKRYGWALDREEFDVVYRLLIA